MLFVLFTKSLEDFILGFVQGSIMGEFVVSYRNNRSQNLPPNVMAEVGTIIFRRTREIRDAIFTAG